MRRLRDDYVLSSLAEIVEAEACLSLYPVCALTKAPGGRKDAFSELNHRANATQT